MLLQFISGDQFAAFFAVALFAGLVALIIAVVLMIFRE